MRPFDSVAVAGVCDRVERPDGLLVEAVPLHVLREQVLAEAGVLRAGKELVGLRLAARDLGVEHVQIGPRHHRHRQLAVPSSP